MKLLVALVFCLSVAGCALTGEEAPAEDSGGDANYQACVDANGPMNAVGNLMDTQLDANSLATLKRAGENIASAAEQADGDVAAALEALVSVIDQAAEGEVFSRWPKLTQAFAACQA